MKKIFHSHQPNLNTVTKPIRKVSAFFLGATLLVPFITGHGFGAVNNGGKFNASSSVNSSCMVNAVPNLVPYNVETGGDEKGTTEGFGGTSSSPFMMRWTNSDAFSGRGSTEVTIPLESPLKRALVQMGQEYVYENRPYIYETPSTSKYLTLVAQVKAVNNEIPVGWMLRLMGSGERILVQERSPVTQTVLGEWVEIRHTFNIEELGRGEATAFYPVLELGAGRTGKPGYTWRVDSVYVTESDNTLAGN